MENYIVGIGGVAMDVTVRSAAPVVLRDSNPGRALGSPGGVTRNICENLARQGCRVTLLSAVGDDAFGRAVTESSAGAGIDMSHVLVSKTEPTAVYLALLDDTGDMFVAASDFGVVSALSAEYLQSQKDRIRGACAVVTDANLSPEQLEAVLDAAGDVPVFLDPVSEAKARKLRELIGRFYMVKPNRMELAALSELPCETDADIENAAGRLLDRGCRSVAVSLGDRGCYFCDRDGNRLFRALTPCAGMKNATGAGDAFMAGYVSGFAWGLSVPARLDRALAAGRIAVEGAQTINPLMSDEKLRDVIERYAKRGKENEFGKIS